MSDAAAPPDAAPAPRAAPAFPPGPLAIPTLDRPPVCTWRVPGSKSITNRALVLAALAEGTSVLEGAQTDGDDTRRMQEALAALGIGVRVTSATTLEIDGGRARLHPPDGPLEVGNSGTTVRFLAALAALVPGEVTLRGDAAMAGRPIADLVAALGALGVRIDCPTGCPPLTVHGPRLPGGRITLRADRSSQYLSALLLAAALGETDLHVALQGALVSRPFVEMTRRLVAAFGGRVDEAADGGGLVARAVGAYRPTRLVVEPDASAASYAFAAAAATGGRITVPGLGADAMQGDYAFAGLLERAGARIERGPAATTVRGPTGTATGARLRGIDADMHDISDTVMTLAALAPLCDGPTTIRNVANIRIKETDRLKATADELRRLGQEVVTGDDWLRVEPRPVRPAVVRTYGDHRMAMSFAVLGLARPGISIEDPACVAKTYPGFWRDVGALYEATGVPRPF